MTKKLKIRVVDKNELEIQKIVNSCIDEHNCKVVVIEPEKPEEPEPEAEEPEAEEPEAEEPGPEEPEEPEEGDFLDYSQMAKKIPNFSQSEEIINFVNLCSVTHYLDLIIISYIIKYENGKMNNIDEISRNVYHFNPVYKHSEIKKAVKNLKLILPPDFYKNRGI